MISREAHRKRRDGGREVCAFLAAVRSFCLLLFASLFSSPPTPSPPLHLCARVRSSAGSAPTDLVAVLRTVCFDIWPALLLPRRRRRIARRAVRGDLLVAGVCFCRPGRFLLRGDVARANRVGTSLRPLILEPARARSRPFECVQPRFVLHRPSNGGHAAASRSRPCFHRLEGRTSRDVVVVPLELGGEQDGTVDCDGQTAMTASDHDGNDDELRQRPESVRQGGGVLSELDDVSSRFFARTLAQLTTYGVVAEGETDVPIGRNDFEDDGEHVDLAIDMRRGASLSAGAE